MSGAKVTGSVRADKVIIAGELEGNIESASQVNLLATGSVGRRHQGRLADSRSWCTHSAGRPNSVGRTARWPSNGKTTSKSYATGVRPRQRVSTPRPGMPGQRELARIA
jgi:hypothetical protein